MDDQASSPGPSPRSDRGLGCPCIAVPAAVPTRPAYKVKGEVPEGLLRRRAQEETEREAVVKVSYTRKEARRLSSRERRSVLSHSAWPLRCPDWNRLWSFIGIAVLKRKVRHLSPQQGHSGKPTIRISTSALRGWAWGARSSWCQRRLLRVSTRSVT